MSKQENTISFQERMRAFTQPLPPDALKPIPYKAGGGLTDINVGFVIARLNECFGEGGWQYETELVSSEYVPSDEKSKGEYHIMMMGKLTFPEYGKTFGPMYNAHSKKDAGDAIKGAQTGAFMQVVKYMGLGKEVYMGLYDNDSQTYNKPIPAPFTLETAIMEIEEAESRSDLLSAWKKYQLFANDADLINAFHKMGKKFPKQQPQPAK